MIEQLPPPRRGDGLDLYKIWILANEWCPPKARWGRLLDPEMVSSWGPAHELGHALIEPRSRRWLPDYGACSAGFCQCRSYNRCDIHEIAAMMISSRLVTYAGRPDLVAVEIDETTDYDLINDQAITASAKQLLRRLRLWPVPYTVSRLERALARRGLTRMQIDPIPPSEPAPIRGSLALGLLVDEIAGAAAWREAG